MAAPPPPPPPPELPEVMQEEILLRFPPDDPARLVQAALVCKPWRRLVSGPGFRGRYREFHRSRSRSPPPLLGLFCNTDEGYNPELGTCGPDIIRFVQTSASSSTAPGDSSRKSWWWVTDARHGRVLLHRTSEDGASPAAGCHGLMVWDPTTGDKKELPLPEPALTHTNWWTAAVLCDAAGACRRLDCHLEPFVVVFVASVDYEGTFISTYSSSAASWSMPIVSTEHSSSWCCVPELTHAAHLGNALYTLMTGDSFILKYDLELQEMSWIEGPRTSSRSSYVALTTTEGGGLELAIQHKSRSRLNMWSWKDAPTANANWTQSRAVQLGRLDGDLGYSPKVLGFAADIGVIVVKDGDKLYTIDLKTDKLITKTKVAATRKHICFVFPYFSFCAPCISALEEVVTIGGEEPTARGGAEWRQNQAPAPLVQVNFVNRDCNYERRSTCCASAPTRLHEIRTKAPGVGLQVCLDWTSSSNLQQDSKTEQIPDM